MEYYLSVFLLSIWGTRNASRASSKFSIFIYSIIALLPPIILAGIRNYTVGSDVDFYILRVFNSASMVEGNYLKLKEIEKFEPLYLLLNCITAKISHNSIAILTAIETTILLPIYIAAMRMKKYFSPAFFMFIYYFTFYNDTLSIVRQGMALSFIMLALSYYIENRKLHCLIYLIISIGFHYSSIIGLFIPLLYKITQKYSFKEYYLRYIFMFIIILFMFTSLDYILLFLIFVGFINEKYIIYTSQSEIFEGDLGLANIVLRFFIIVYILIYFYKNKHIKDSSFFLFVIAIMDLIFSFSGLITNHLSRISLYFKIVSCITLSYIYYNMNIYVTKTSIMVIKSKVVISILIIVYWLYVYIHGNYNDTANYIINPKVLL